MQKLKKYIWNVLIAIDQLANALLLGDPDETISSRIGKIRHKNKFADFLSRLLHLIDKNHVEESREDDEGSDEIKL